MGLPPEELRRRLDEIDKKLAAEMVPASHRVVRACRELARDVVAFPNGHPLFQGPEYEAVKEYFEKKYSPEPVRLAQMEVPFLFEGEIYFHRIPLLFNWKISSHAKLDPFSWLTAPNQVIQRLRQSPADRKEYIEDCFSRLYTARVVGDRASFAGIDNYQDAVDNLRKHRLNIAAWSVMQCAERAAKEFLKAIGIIDEKAMKNLGHRMEKILQKCIEVEEGCEEIKEALLDCGEPNVDFRYETEPKFTLRRIYDKVRSAFAVWAFFNDLVDLHQRKVIYHVSIRECLLWKRMVGGKLEPAWPKEFLDVIRNERDRDAGDRACVRIMLKAAEDAALRKAT